MTAKAIIEFPEKYCKEACEQLGLSTAEEFAGVLKAIFADEIRQSEFNDVKLSVEVAE